MAGTDKIAIEQGFDWQNKFSELFSTALEGGKTLLESKLTENVEQAKQETLAAQTQVQSASMKTKTEMLFYLAMAVFLGVVIFRTVKKRG